MQPHATIPVTLIGGYLGAGKTTLVNQVLRAAAGQRLTVLVNDFGDVNIDADLIETTSDRLWQLAGGCVCCAIGSDLIGALQAIERAATRPDRVIVETSGVALPGQVATALRLAPGFTLDAIIVLAATDLIEQQLADRYVGDTVLAQLRDADVIVAGRADLAPPTTLQRVLGRLAELAPRARRVVAPAAEIATRVVLDASPAGPSATPPRAPSHFPPDAPSGPPPAGLAGAALSTRPIRPTESSHASARFESVTLSLPMPTDTGRWLARLCDPALGVVRAKGVLDDLDGRARLLQTVAGRGSVTPVATRPANAGQLVCIAVRGALAGSLADRLAQAMAELVRAAPSDPDASAVANLHPVPR